MNEGNPDHLAPVTDAQQRPGNQRRRGAEDFGKGDADSKQRGLFLEFVNTARDAALKHVFAKVEKISEFYSGQPEIGLHLFLMGGRSPLNRFEFKQNFLFHNEVSAEALVENDTLINDRHRDLPLNHQSKIGQLTGKDGLVNRLKETWAKRSMNTNRRFKDLGANVIFSHLSNILCASAPLRETFPSLPYASSR
jgi:hypothetical protein